jgi:peptidoglycan/xylan/chitin deacetylase (PgdA/CDA1 family)
VDARRLLRRGALAAAELPPFTAIVDALERVDGRDDVFAVLVYHRIGYPQRPSELDPSLISATPEAFEAQIAHLASCMNVLSLDDLLDVRHGRTRLPRGAVAVTFDDAYRDFAEYAWPTLRRCGVPATLFVPTAYPDRPELAFWWDRLHAAISATSQRSLRVPSGTLPLRDASERLRAFRALRREVQRLEHARALALVASVEAELEARPSRGCVLGWDALRSLAREGLAIAPHTRTHPLLDRLDPQAVEEELLGSMRDLERELGSAVPALAYPGGSDSDAVRDCVDRTGFELAFTTCRGKNRVGSIDWLRLRRLNVGVHTPLAAVRAQLLAMPCLHELSGSASG